MLCDKAAAANAAPGDKNGLFRRHHLSVATSRRKYTLISQIILPPTSRRARCRSKFVSPPPQNPVAGARGISVSLFQVDFRQTHVCVIIKQVLKGKPQSKIPGGLHFGTGSQDPLAFGAFSDLRGNPIDPVILSSFRIPQSSGSL